MAKPFPSEVGELRVRQALRGRNVEVLRIIGSISRDSTPRPLLPIAVPRPEPMP